MVHIPSYNRSKSADNVRFDIEGEEIKDASAVTSRYFEMKTIYSLCSVYWLHKNLQQKMSPQQNPNHIILTVSNTVSIILVQFFHNLLSFRSLAAKCVSGTDSVLKAFFLFKFNRVGKFYNVFAEKFTEFLRPISVEYTLLRGR